LAGIIGQRISSALQNGLRQEGRVSADPEEEERQWRSVLYKLVRRNSDGTVKTDVVSEKSLCAWIEDAKLSGDPTAMLDWLARPDTLVLRRFTTRNNDILYSLGHDAIGLALYEWVLREEEAQRQRKLREEEEWHQARILEEEKERQQKLIEQERFQRLETEVRSRQFRQKMFFALSGTIFSALLGWFLIYSSGKATEVRVLMSAANRLLVTDYGLGVWAGFQASHLSAWIPNVFLGDDEAKGVFAKLLAAGPVRVIQPYKTDEGTSNAVILPGTGRFIFFAGAGHLKIVTAAGAAEKGVARTEDLKTFDLSSQLSADVGVASELQTASELDDGSIALWFRQFRRDGVRRDEPIGDKIVVLNPTGTSKVYSSSDFMDQSDSLKQRISALRTDKTQDSNVRNPSLLLIGNYVYIYASTELYLLVDLFRFDPSSPSGFKHGFLYEDKPQGTPEKASSGHRYYAVDGLVIVWDSVDRPSQAGGGTLAKLRFKILQVIDLHGEASDPANGEGPKAVWNDIVSRSQTLKTCSDPDTLFSCSIQNLSVSDRDSKLMVLNVNLESKDTKKIISKLVVIDTGSLKSRDLDVNLLNNLRGIRSADAPDISDTIMVFGNLSDMYVGLPENQSIHLYHIEDSPSFIGTIAWNDDISEWGVNPDKSLLLGISSGNGLVWDFAMVPSDRGVALAKKPLGDLIHLGCELGLLGTPPERDIWQRNTGLSSRPSAVSCN
jgi:hypothetical protein